MELGVHQDIDDEQGKHWELYQRAFAEMRTTAVQRHLMHRGEFDQVMHDDRITKYVVRDPDRGRLSGLATMTSDLDAVPLIEPEYFKHHYPDLVAVGRLHYVSFVAVDPDYQGTGTMGLIIGEMCQQVSPTGGMICLDIAERNEAVHHLPTAIERIGNTFSPGTARHRLDAQVFWAYRLPTPA